MAVASARSFGRATRTSPIFVGGADYSEVVDDLRKLALPWPPGGKVKEAINRAASAAGFEFWRTSDIWYGKARRVEEFERDAIATALAKKRKEAARNELKDLRIRIMRIESILARIDPDFDCENIDQARSQLCEMDGSPSYRGRPMDRGASR